MTKGLPGDVTSVFAPEAQRSLSSSTGTVGFWSAVFATAFSLTYVVAQIAEWLGWLGSRGGPESSSTALGIVVLLTPSLFLGSSFLVLTISIHQLAAPEKKVPLCAQLCAPGATRQQRPVAARSAAERSADALSVQLPDLFGTVRCASGGREGACLQTAMGGALGRGAGHAIRPAHTGRPPGHHLDPPRDEERSAVLLLQRDLRRLNQQAYRAEAARRCS